MRMWLVIGLVAGCNEELVCGPGTVKHGTECVTGTPVEPCGDAGVVIGGHCYRDPNLLCGPDSMWDPVLQQCRGNPGGGCAANCSAPGNQTVCISGHVASFVDPNTLATSTTGLKVRAYDPIAFVTSSTPMILG